MSANSVIKTLNGHLADAGQPIEDALQSYLEKHSRSDGETPKLQDGLVNLFHNSIPDQKGLSLFIQALAKLTPNLMTHEIIMFWVQKLMEPFLGSGDSSRLVISSFRAWAGSILLSESDNDPKVLNGVRSRFLEILVDGYVRVSNPSREGQKASGPHNVGQDDQIVACLEDVLFEFGRKESQMFFSAIDAHFVRPDERLQMLNLLSLFFRLQAPRIYQVMDTELFEHILTCLEMDTSTTIVSLALTCLVMLLPNICNTLVPYLNRLFGVYTRVLLWDQFGAAQRLDSIYNEGNGLSNGESAHAQRGTRDWARIGATFDQTTSVPPNPAQLYTFLYGLYPINLIKFIRAPHDLTIGNADLVDEEMIRTRSESLIKRHTLHPNFCIYTAETELSDTKRWTKTEPADVVATCIGLDTMVSPQQNSLPGSNMTSPTEIHSLDRSFPSLNLAETAQSCLASPAFKPLDAQRPPTSQMRSHQYSKPTVQEMLNVHTSNASEEIDSQMTRSTNITPRAVPPNSSLLSSGSPDTLTSGKADHSTVSKLQRTILLLQNDLNFERYLKQQHLQHIGRLLRVHILDAAVEAERQSLYNTNKSQRQQIHKLEGLVQQQRTMSAASKAQRQKSEADLHNKLRVLREDKKTLQLDLEAVGVQLTDATNEQKQLLSSMAALESESLSSKQRSQSLEQQIEGLKMANRRLEEERRDFFQIDEFAHQRQQEDHDQAQNGEAWKQVNKLKLKLSSLEFEMERLQSESTQRINELEDYVKSMEAENKKRAKKNSMPNKDSTNSAPSSLREAHTALLRHVDALEHYIINLRAEVDEFKQKEELRKRANDSMIERSRSDMTSELTRPAMQRSPTTSLEKRASQVPTFFRTKTSSIFSASENLRPTLGGSGANESRYHGRGGAQSKKGKK